MLIISLVLYQVRKLLQKVTTDDTLRYRKLIEKAVLISKEEDDQPTDVSLGKINCTLISLALN
jgi:hypothetical protein